MPRGAIHSQQATDQVSAPHDSATQMYSYKCMRNCHYRSTGIGKGLASLFAMVNLDDRQNKRITEPLDSQSLEELASQSVRVSSEESDPPPLVPLAATSARVPRSTERSPKLTIEPAAAGFLGLIDVADPASPIPPPSPAPASATASNATARLVRTRSRDDFMTERMQAEQFKALLQDAGGLMPITPALLESVDWYREADAAARRTMTAQWEPEDLLEKLGREAPAGGTTEPAPDARSSTPSLEQLAGRETAPSAGPGQPAQGGDEQRETHPTNLQRPLARPAPVRLLVSLVAVALGGGFLGHAVVGVIAGLVAQT